MKNTLRSLLNVMYTTPPTDAMQKSRLFYMASGMQTPKKII